MEPETLALRDAVQVITTPALGDQSYLVVDGDEALLVDPQRDSWSLVQACRDGGLRIRYVLETHVHNDYLSGALEICAATGARVVASDRAGYEFPYLGLDDGDELRLGDLTVRAWATPGHTPEHLAYLVCEPAATSALEGQGSTRTRPDSRPVAVFTGGSLISGGAGRTDLLGQHRAAELARAQFRSLRRLATLPDATWVLPTHGWGSFCSSSAHLTRSTSTIGTERLENPVLRAPDEDTFVRERLGVRRPFPAYYGDMARLNRAGPALLRRLPAMAPLTVEQTAEVADSGWVVDTRDRWAFAAAHIPGSINIELSDSLATYLGWLIPLGVPIAFILPESTAEAAQDVMKHLVRIGYEPGVGYLPGGIQTWRDVGGPVRSYPARDVAALTDRPDDSYLLDVRLPGEFAAGHLPDSRNIHVGDLAKRCGELPVDREVWTICQTGRRAALAASLLDRAGFPVTAVTSGGVPVSLQVRSGLDCSIGRGINHRHRV